MSLLVSFHDMMDCGEKESVLAPHYREGSEVCMVKSLGSTHTQTKEEREEPLLYILALKRSHL